MDFTANDAYNLTVDALKGNEIVKSIVDECLERAQKYASKGNFAAECPFETKVVLDEKGGFSYEVPDWTHIEKAMSVLSGKGFFCSYRKLPPNFLAPTNTVYYITLCWDKEKVMLMRLSELLEKSKGK